MDLSPPLLLLCYYSTFMVIFMKRPIRRLFFTVNSFGFNPIRFFLALFSIPFYLLNLFVFLRKYSLFSANKTIDTHYKFTCVPILGDRFLPPGTFKGHYFHADLWTAQKIYLNNPINHLDIGSRIDGLVSHLLCFRSVHLLDVRAVDSSIEGVTFIQADICTDISDGLFGLYDSISSIHALEHFGLGRYGDKPDPYAWQHAILNMKNMLSPGGDLYLGFPIGRPVIEFDAHIIFEPLSILNKLEEYGFTLLSSAYIDDNGDFHPEFNSSYSLISSIDYGFLLLHLRSI